MRSLPRQYSGAGLKTHSSWCLVPAAGPPQMVGCNLWDDLQVEVPARLSGVVRLSADSCSLLKEGDVVLINSDGKVTGPGTRSESQHNIIAITNKCNCKCVMCPQPANNDGDTITEVNEKLSSV